MFTCTKHSSLTFMSDGRKDGPCYIGLTSPHRESLRFHFQVDDWVPTQRSKKTQFALQLEGWICTHGCTKPFLQSAICFSFFTHEVYCIVTLRYVCIGFLCSMLSFMSYLWWIKCRYLAATKFPLVDNTTWVYEVLGQSLFRPGASTPCLRWWLPLLLLCLTHLFSFIVKMPAPKMPVTTATGQPRWWCCVASERLLKTLSRRCGWMNVSWRCVLNTGQHAFKLWLLRFAKVIDHINMGNLLLYFTDFIL